MPKVKIEERPDGSLIFVLGCSRSGKTHWLKQQIKKAGRILAWDLKGEYGRLPGYREFTNIFALLKFLQGPGLFGNVKVAYTGPMVVRVNKQKINAFELFCHAALIWIQADADSVVVAEELADVSNPGKAVPGWGDLVRKGLCYGPRIYAVSQRPQEVDRTIFGNATMTHAHMLNNDEDTRFLASRIGVDMADMPTKKYFYIEKSPSELVRKGKTTA